MIAVAALAGGSTSSSPAGARAPLAMFEEEGHLLSDPVGTLRALRSLGVGVVRVSLSWKRMAPATTSARPPAGFDGADPNAYPPGTWEAYDTIVKDAQADGIAIEFLVSGGAPRWALGPGVPSGSTTLEWRPSPLEYGKWVRAVATRYDGRFRRTGASSPLPRVHFWEIWNEPNYGQNLAPQAVGGSSVLASPGLYRGLLNAGWSALQATGHAGDTIIMGSLSPRGFRAPVSPRFLQGLPGYFSTTKPLQFLRALYCVDAGYRELRGQSALSLGCPATSQGSEHFRSENPGLFDASGFGIHPYPFDLPPNQVDSHDPDFAEFAQLPRLAGVLDRLQQAYHSSTRLQLYNTEFGYITDPPNRTIHYGRHFLSPAKAAANMNWAEYLTWRDPRLATTMQYLLYDPYPTASGFATGLLFYDGTPKPTYDAYRLPLYLPVTRTARGQSLEVWGCVRPAHYASIDSHGAVQQVQIQFRNAGATTFRTIVTQPVHNTAGYLDTRLSVPGSGDLRLAWRDPLGANVFSRIVAVTES
ncbi:MAG: hypothetical protein ACR2JH_02205 [Solirubrobacteraceae bacterium]